MNKELLSIIVPIYNTEQYLERCLNSIVNQTYTNFEVIMIDDGSTDSSATICKQYCEKDIRFHYFLKKNEGVSIARNKGLQLAKGDIIGFIDSDDCINENMYEKMLTIMEKENSDIVICDAIDKRNDETVCIDTITSIHNSCSLKKEEITPKVLIEIAGAVWRCIYKKSSIKNVTFPKKLKLSEDCVFNLCAMGKCNKITYTKEALYQRICRPDSAVYSYHEDRFFIVLHAYKLIIECLHQYWSDLYKNVFDTQFILNCVSIIDSICSTKIKKSVVYRYNNIRLICDNNDVHEISNYISFSKTNINMRIKWIRKKKYLNLLLFSMVLNFLKNR